MTPTDWDNFTDATSATIDWGSETTSTSGTVYYIGEPVYVNWSELTYDRIAKMDLRSYHANIVRVRKRLKSNVPLVRYNRRRMNSQSGIITNVN